MMPSPAFVGGAATASTTHWTARLHLSWQLGKCWLMPTTTNRSAGGGSIKTLAEMGKFATVVIDPPWPLAPIGLKAHGWSELPIPYQTVSLQDIAAFPVGATLADDAMLFVWTVNKYLPDTFGLLAEWGCRYTFTMTWVKGGGVQTPVTPCFNSEWVLVGRKGKPKFTDTKAFATANYWPRAGHSAKPEGFYDLLRRVTPGPRLDIFGRRRIAGFESWGNEAPEGAALPDHYQQVLLDA